MMEIKTPSPPWSGGGKMMESMLRKAIFDFDLLEGKGKVGVALSGGKDSMALLCLLKGVSGKGFPDLDIHAFHIHGAFSCGSGVQVEYLKAFCGGLRVKLHVEEVDQKLEELECYSCSRKRRSKLFEMARKNGIDLVAFGHHRDDLAETLLMNLLHKGEFAGLLPKVPMMNYGVTIIRPLVYISEDEITNFAKQQGFLRVMCQCPVGQQSMRKKVKSLLAEIEDLYPHARGNIAKASLEYGSNKALQP
jgi:tRNA 2-thiocytidine biosynthesis protein TtcA